MKPIWKRCNFRVCLCSDINEPLQMDLQVSMPIFSLTDGKELPDLCFHYVLLLFLL